MQLQDYCVLREWFDTKIEDYTKFQTEVKESLKVFDENCLYFNLIEYKVYCETLVYYKTQMINYNKNGYDDNSVVMTLFNDLQKDILNTISYINGNTFLPINLEMKWKLEMMKFILTIINPSLS